MEKKERTYFDGHSEIQINVFKEKDDVILEMKEIFKKIQQKKEEAQKMTDAPTVVHQEMIDFPQQFEEKNSVFNGVEFQQIVDDDFALNSPPKQEPRDVLESNCQNQDVVVVAPNVTWCQRFAELESQAKNDFNSKRTPRQRTRKNFGLNFG